jgi:hypothetical protein
VYTLWSFEDTGYSLQLSNLGDLVLTDPNGRKNTLIPQTTLANLSEDTIVPVVTSIHDVNFTIQVGSLTPSTGTAKPGRSLLV